MSDKSAIEWTRSDDGAPGATWNPLRADAAGHKDRWYCEKLSPGCDNCYASTFNRRLGGHVYPHVGDNPESFTWHGISPVHLDHKALARPFGWKRGRRIFVCSMTDLFGEWVTDEQIAEIFAVMAATPQHTYMVLTKRPSRMAKLLTKWATDDESQFWEAAVWIGTYFSPGPFVYSPSIQGWPLPNVWCGATIELAQFKWRANVLRQTPAAVRFISFEPLLDDIGPIDLTGIHWAITGGESGPKGRWLVERCSVAENEPQCCLDAPDGEKYCNRCAPNGWAPTVNGLVAVQNIQAQCRKAGVAFFHKQWGGPTPKAGGRLLGGRTWDEFPAARELAPA